MMTVFADGVTQNPEAAGFSGMSVLIVYAVIIAIFYFLMIRPQKKQEKKMREMIAALKVGDEVTTIGGIKGKIRKIKDDIVVVETGTDKTPIEFEKSAIKSVTTIE